MSKSISNFLWLFSLITTPLIAAAMPNIFIPEEVLISEQTGIIIEMLVNLEDLEEIDNKIKLSFFPAIQIEYPEIIFENNTTKTIKTTKILQSISISKSMMNSRIFTPIEGTECRFQIRPTNNNLYQVKIFIPDVSVSA